MQIATENFVKLACVLGKLNTQVREAFYLATAMQCTCLDFKEIRR